MNDPALLAKMQAELNVDSDDESAERFQGHGHKLGGDKYANKLLGIDHKEGKRLARLARKQAKAARFATAAPAA